MSAWCTCRPLAAASARSECIEENWATGAKVSLKSMLSRCRLPCATSRALCPVISPSAFRFVFQTNLDVTMVAPVGTVKRSLMVKTLKSLHMELNSSSAALAHTSRLSLDIASRQVCGSLVMDLTDWIMRQSPLLSGEVDCRTEVMYFSVPMRQSPLLSGEVDCRTEVMRGKLKNGKGARTGIGPVAGEIARALRQLRASKPSRAPKSPPQGGGLAGVRDDRGASVELRVDSSHGWPQLAPNEVEFVGRLLSQCGLAVHAELGAVHVRWVEANPGL
ncbi:BQ5605_C038g11682 [Microbotryum silenes-dioicae]|uniref:BQ5605_C038g11682 protein n=1 Tax=Microbotryum silenes-dioicae TaxID=796604 RepID=A0A2X0PFX6_9BASI|nr:BQ5605_C038g11682 [Microbotryum silenes-dioicae]